MANKTLICNRCQRIFKEKTDIGGLSAGKAAVGAVLAGPAGAIVGAVMGKKVRNEKCPYCDSSDLSLV